MRIQPRSTCSGNILALVLFITGLMGVSLASYLWLVRNQNLSVMRSLSWNTCVPVMEAGVEEALTHINDSGITNLFSSGWTLSTNGYTRTRYLGDSYYTVTISTDNPPTVTSQAYVPAPSNPTAAALAWLATVNLNLSGGGLSTRMVQVRTRQDSLWTHAMVAKGSINLNGNNIATDSFDSGDPNYSTAGQYDANKHKDNGDVATNSTITNSLNVGNADIWGKTSTGPGGSVSIGPNGSVGDSAWHQSHNGIEPGWSSNDMNVYFKDVTVPFNSGFSPQSGTLGGTSYAYLLDGGPSGTDYQISDLKLQSSQVMLVTNHVRLLVTGSISIAGNAKIQIAPGASLQLYMQGTSASLGGNGISNNSGNATNFIYFGTPSHTSLSFSGNGAFIGAIYAPNAAFSLGGGGNNTQDFIGASVTSTVSMNGHFHFHYDEALGRAGWGRGYLIDSWNEL